MIFTTGMTRGHVIFRISAVECWISDLETFPHYVIPIAQRGIMNNAHQVHLQSYFIEQ